MDERDLNPLSRNLPDASMIPGNTPKEKPPMNPVVNQPIVLKKKPWYVRVRESIFDGDTGTIGGYVVKEIILPAVRDTIYDMVTGGLSMALYSTPRATKGKKGTIVNYSSYYDGRTRPKQIERADKYRTQLDIYNISLPSDTDNPADKSASAKGYAALEALGDRLSIYDEVTVQDLYDVLAIGSAPATMRNWGWNDISNARVDFDRGEWVLRMPKAIPLR